MIYVALDDTDNLESRGTGYLARMLAELVASDHTVYGVTRHQLLQDPRVPCTKKNSCAALHIQADGALDLAALAERVACFVQERCASGSDPAVCVARQVPEAISAFGRRAQRSIVSQSEARALAQAHGILLRGLGGSEDGVIGALAGVGLAATGNDGRFVLVGSVRELTGPRPIQAILAAGVGEVRDLAGRTIAEGMVATQDRLRPALREGKPILYVEPGERYWQPVRLD